MKGETADKLYQACEEFVEGTGGDASDLYNILEGHAIQYLDEIEGDV